MKEIRMRYRDYKQHYADCGNLGDYDKNSRTITVLVPDGRIKESGTRGQSFHYYEFHGIESRTGRQVQITIKATYLGNATKRLPSDCEWKQAGGQND